MSADIPRMRKLLSLALDRSASEEEAANAAGHFVKLARKAGMTVDRLMSGHTVYVEKIVYRDAPAAAPPPPPPPQELCMTFGKHKGTPVKELLVDDPNYCHWLLDNCANMPKKLKAFLQEHLK